MNYFTDKEFQCHCGCGLSKMDDGFLSALNMARHIAGFPFIITSGFRCPKHDKAVNGEGNHPTGKASDIKAADSYHRLKLIEALLKTGFVRIGIGKDFIHADTVLDHPQNVCWLY